MIIVNPQLLNKPGICIIKDNRKEKKMCETMDEVGIRITKECLMMSFAKEVAKRSTCKRNQVGAVITDYSMKYVLGYGYNGNYAGGPNECDTSIKGKCGCIHAEVNALIKCHSKEGGRKMFVTVSPCLECAKLIINAGISILYYNKAYRLLAPIKLLRKEGVTIHDLSKVNIFEKIKE